MSSEWIDYRELTCEAFRGVMAKALSRAAESGLPGDHHFFITYLTGHPGVVMPDWLREDYPEQITIVLQYEYADLAVSADRFSVSLSFKGIPCTLVVPFSAISEFVDPSVDFRLQVPIETSEMGEATADAVDASDLADEPAPAGDDASADDGDGDGDATVVSLDSFRKK